MTLSDLQLFIGSLTNDPDHTRYDTTAIGTELDNSQDDWNVKAKILSDTVTLTIVAGTRQYALTGLTGTPISFPRVTHKGLELKKVDKAWLDLYSGSDWTLDTGTPQRFFIESTDPDLLMLTVHPTPQDADAGANLVAEYIKRHTPMSAASDVPFMSGTASNYLLRPYDWGLGYDAAARLLARDPTPENLIKIAGRNGLGGFNGIGKNVLADVIQVFKALNKQEPMRMRGGRRW